MSPASGETYRLHMPRTVAAAAPVALQELNGKSPSARVALENAGSIAGAGWEAFGMHEVLRVLQKRLAEPIGRLVRFPKHDRCARCLRQPSDSRARR